MPIDVDYLRLAAKRYSATQQVTLSEAKERGLKTIFLCHSHRDLDLVKGLIYRLRQGGLHSYVDYEDAAMPSSPNEATANRIEEKIKKLQLFVFLATPNSMASRWCPWEIGYADGVKKREDIILVRTTEQGKNYGNQYLNLYREITWREDDRLCIYEPGSTQNGILLEDF